MGLFTRDEGNRFKNGYVANAFYSAGQRPLKLVIGLGNLGEQYSRTRHNVGFTVVDSYQEKHEIGEWQEKAKFKVSIVETNVDNTPVMLAKPHTMMNLSGEAVKAIKNYYKVENENILVVYDELDVPFGTIRTRIGGGSAGHNGIKSLIDAIGDSFWRCRIGVQNEQSAVMDSADFVLGRFNDDETLKLPLLASEAGSIIGDFINDQIKEETRRFIL